LLGVLLYHENYEISNLMEDWHNCFHMTIRKHHLLFCHQILEIFEEKCNIEHTIMEAEAGGQVKEPQRMSITEQLSIHRQ
jgi:hypothetical protein